MVCIVSFLDKETSSSISDPLLPLPEWDVLYLPEREKLLIVK